MRIPVLVRLLVPSLAVLGTVGAMDWPGIDIHGFVSQGYLHSSGNNFVARSREGTWQYNEVGLNISSQVTDRLRVGAQIFAYDLGDFGNNEILIDWAYGDYRHNDFIGIRAGRFKLPLGLYNEVLDLDLATNPVLLPQAVYDARYRDIVGGANGIQLYGTIPLAEATAVDYQLFGGSTNLPSDGFLALQFQEGAQAYSRVDTVTIDDIYGLQLNVRPGITGLRLLGAVLVGNDLQVTGQIPMTVGLNTVQLPAESTVQDMVIADVGIEYTVDQWLIACEYRIIHGDIDVLIDASGVGFGMIPAMQAVRSDGGYVQVAYRIDERWEVGSYYGVYFGNRNDREGDNQVAAGNPDWYAWQRDWAVSLRCDINDFWIVKVEGHYLNGVSMLSPAENPDGFEENWFLFAAKTTMSF